MSKITLKVQKRNTTPVGANFECKKRWLNFCRNEKALLRKENLDLEENLRQKVRKFLGAKLQ